LLGQEVLGLYFVAMQLASLPVKKISSVVNQVAFPAFAQTQHDSRLVAQYILKSLRLLYFVAVPILWGISSIAKEIVDVILGANWQAAVVPLQLLPIIMPLTMISPFLNTAFQGIGKPGIVFKNVLTASAILPPAFLIGANWDLLGLSLAWILGFPVVLAINLRRMLPLVGLRWGQVLGAAAPASVGGCAMYAAVMLTRHVAQPMEAPIRMVVLIVVGALTYSSVIWVVNREGFRELADLLGRSRKRV
jgi:O-antigen/teichoic acid export membrane protein